MTLPSNRIPSRTLLPRTVHRRRSARRTVRSRCRCSAARGSRTRTSTTPAPTPALASVQLAVDRALAAYSSARRGSGYASQLTTHWYEQARAEVGRFVRARADDVVLFTRNTTDSLNLLARAVPAKTTCIVFESEHHAALLAWDARRTVRLPVPGSVADALTLLQEALLAQRGRPALVAVTGASNVTGQL